MRPLFLRLALGLAATAVFCLGLSAQDASKAVDLGEFVVEADAGSPLALAPAGSTVTIDAKAIQASGSATVAELVAAAPGVTINSYGAEGSSQTISLRGATSGQVLVILDGQRLNDARQGAPDLSLIPAESIEKVEILSGGASAVYGADALGGVVVITTKRPSGRHLGVELSNVSWPTALASNGVASLGDAQRASVDSGFTLGEASIGLTATGEMAKNAYPYGGTATRINTDFRSASGELKAEFPLAGGLVSTKLSGAWQDAGVPGALGDPSPFDQPTPYSSEIDSSLRGSLGWSSDALAGGLVSMDIQAQGALSRLDIKDPTYPGLYDGGRGGLELRASALVSDAVNLGFGGSLAYEGTNSTVFDSLAGGQPSRISGGVYLEPIITAGAFKLTPALRYDASSDYSAGLSAMLGVTYAASRELELRLSGGSSYRAPTFNELWWPYMSNSALKPEHGISGELGFSWHSGGLALTAAAFGRYVQDLILNDATWTPQNIGLAFTPGANLTVGYEFAKLLRLSGNYEFIYPLDLSGGKSLAEGTLIGRYSLHQAKGSMDLDLGRVKTGLSLRWWSDRPSVSLPGALVTDLRAKVELSKSLAFSLAVDNLFNQSYQEIMYYPAPGLRVVTGLKLTL
jgi:vitamin B12 transporter